MNRDTTTLKRLLRIYRNLREMEEIYAELELEDERVPSTTRYFVDSYLQLNEHLEATVNIENLTEKKLEDYAKLNARLYERLRSEYFRLYAIAGNVSDIFAQAYEIMEDTVREQIKPYGLGRPILPCGFTFVILPVPKYSLLEALLRDKLVAPEHFLFENGRINIEVAELNKKYRLTGQEYEIYGVAFRKCVDFLNARLKLNGTVESYID